MEIIGPAGLTDAMLAGNMYHLTFSYFGYPRSLHKKLEILLKIIILLMTNGKRNRLIRIDISHIKSLCRHEYTKMENKTNEILDDFHLAVRFSIITSLPSTYEMPKLLNELLLFYKCRGLYYFHFSDYCPHLCRHVYHNVSVMVLPGLLQVFLMSNFTLYFAYWGRLF